MREIWLALVMRLALPFMRMHEVYAAGDGAAVVWGEGFVGLLVEGGGGDEFEVFGVCWAEGSMG